MPCRDRVVDADYSRNLARNLDFLNSQGVDRSEDESFGAPRQEVQA